MSGMPKVAKRRVRIISSMTWHELARHVDAVKHEAKRRNPIGINFYIPALDSAVQALTEIANAEDVHFTSECGPRTRCRGSNGDSQSEDR